MARAILVLVLASGAAACRVAAPAAPPSPSVSPGLTRVGGRAVRWPRECPGGGARVLSESRKDDGIPLAGLELLVQPGSEIASVEPFASVSTALDGTWSVEVPDGTWCVYRASRRLTASVPEDAPPSPSADDSAAFDPACLRSVRLQCDATFIVPGGMPPQADVSVADECPQPFNQPCYRGPLPP